MKKFLLLSVIILLGVAGWKLWDTTVSLDRQITSQFEGARWELPARIYGRPLDLYAGKELQPQQLRQELELLGYQSVDNTALEKAGEYQINGARALIHCRSFTFSDGLQPAAVIELSFTGNHLASLTDRQSGEPLPFFRLEPLLIASIYPGDNEDRLLLHIKEVPELLIKTLLLVEDKSFYHHLGVRPVAILRALFANIKAGRTVQGGSTLTQQLVKNFFLTNKRSLKRKAKEAIMALLLEYHYSKDEILEAYLNEIYMGQDGKRAIHGFGMASRFYFGRKLDELSASQIALLVGLAKGASHYNPRKHPVRAKARRDKILHDMADEGLLTAATAEYLQQKPLGVLERIPSGVTRYPAFVRLVREQLKRDYKDIELQSRGLTVFTTFDPLVQQAAEASLDNVLSALEKERKMKKESLQGAVVICSVDQGEVLAVVGDRFTSQDGFNRALDMKRPLGSVIKPAIYLSALARPDQYNLLSLIEDSPLAIPAGSKSWKPKNYDKKFHGQVPLMQALVHSYNVATVRLGMALGLETVIGTLHNLGITKEIPAYPSLLLGAIELPPIDVLQMYQVIAAGGYKSTLRAILAVTNQDNELLQRYPLTVEQVVPSGAVFCLKRALEEVTRSGTAASLRHRLPRDLRVAGKTGTTDDLRDSWFAGFSGSHVTVAWVGRDDNHSTGLTGASGALRVWSEIMSTITTDSIEDDQPPEDIDFYRADIRSGMIVDNSCSQGELVPFMRGGILPPVTFCGASPQRSHTRRTRRSQNGFEKALEQGLKQFMRIFQ
ncbi:MAG: penicillin-binding protein 1B [Desulfobulbus sp.]|nr:MAG: penicillin-binding protein 1B [Desulfobulbus sp.]